MNMLEYEYIHDRSGFFRSEDAQKRFFLSFKLTKPLYMLIKIIFLSS